LPLSAISQPTWYAQIRNGIFFSKPPRCAIRAFVPLAFEYFSPVCNIDRYIFFIFFQQASGSNRPRDSEALKSSLQKMPASPGEICAPRRLLDILIKLAYELPALAALASWLILPSFLRAHVIFRPRLLITVMPTPTARSTPN